jgi:hypothetical protein
MPHKAEVTSSNLPSLLLLCGHVKKKKKKTFLTNNSFIKLSNMIKMEGGGEFYLVEEVYLHVHKH